MVAPSDFTLGWIHPHRQETWTPVDLYWQQYWMLLSSPNHWLHFSIIKIITAFTDFRKLWGLHEIESRRAIKCTLSSPLSIYLLFNTHQAIHLKWVHFICKLYLDTSQLEKKNPTVRFHHTFTRMSEIKESDDNKQCWGCGITETFMYW